MLVVDTSDRVDATRRSSLLRTSATGQAHDRALSFRRERKHRFPIMARAP